MDNTKPSLTILIALSLVVVTMAAFWQVQYHEFIAFDDYEYIAANQHVKKGLTRNNIAWAFTSTYYNNWHPLTWLSHMLGFELYGSNPKGHHFNNLLIHIANTVLLFLVLKRMTGGLWQSSFVAALFAIHPLHVESVAWAAERKDVLSTFFWILTVWTYVRYFENPRLRRYWPVLVCFSLGLLSKPMVVTLPFVLLLLDYWPLCRFQFQKPIGIGKIYPYDSKDSDPPKLSLYALVVEKLPLIALAAGSCAVTFMVQHNSGAVKTFEAIPLKLRISNAFLSYVSYMEKMIWPGHLSVFYPHPGNTLSLWEGLGYGLILLIISFLIIRLARLHPYLLVGWLWYLGTLVPVIGLVQVGSQRMADRYTYIPLIGLFVIIAWGIPRLVERWRYYKTALTVSAVLVLMPLAICTWFQVGYWKNSVTLFEHALSVTSNNSLIHNNLGIVLERQGNFREALDHYLETLRIEPYAADAHFNIANVYFQQGELEKAVHHYSEALRIRPDYDKAHNGLGVVLAAERNLDAAISHFAEALRINPDLQEARHNLSHALCERAELDKKPLVIPDSTR